MSRSSNHLWVLMEYCDGCSVSDLLEVLQRGLDEEQISCICGQILHGLVEVHNKNVISRDVKCCNVLLTAQG